MKRKRVSSEQSSCCSNSNHANKFSEHKKMTKVELLLPVLKLSRCDDKVVVPRVKRARLDHEDRIEVISVCESIDSNVTVQCSPGKDEQVMALCLKLCERVRLCPENQFAQRLGVLEQLDDAWSNKKLALLTCLDFDEEPGFLDQWDSSFKAMNSIDIEETKPLIQPFCHDEVKSHVVGLNSKRRNLKKSKPPFPPPQHCVIPPAVNVAPVESTVHSSLGGSSTWCSDAGLNIKSTMKGKKDTTAAMRLKRLGSGLFDPKKIAPNASETMSGEVNSDQDFPKLKPDVKHNGERETATCSTSKKPLGPLSKRLVHSSEGPPAPPHLEKRGTVTDRLSKEDKTQHKPLLKQATSATKDVPELCCLAEINEAPCRTETKLRGPLSKRATVLTKDVSELSCSVDSVETSFQNKTKLRGPMSKRATVSTNDVPEPSCSVENKEAPCQTETKLRGPLSKRVTVLTKDVSELSCSVDSFETSCQTKTKLCGPLSKRATVSTKDVPEPSCSVDSEETSCQTDTKLRGPLSKKATSSSKDVPEPSCSVDSVETSFQTKTKLRGPLSKRATSSSKDVPEPSCSVESEEAPCHTKPKLRGPLSKRATDSIKDVPEQPCSVESEEASCQTKPKLRGPLSKRATSSSKDVPEQPCSVENEEAPCQTKSKLRGPLSKRATSPSKDMTEPSCSVDSEEAPCQTKPKLRGPLSKRATSPSKDMTEPSCSVDSEEAPCQTKPKLRGPLSKRATSPSKDMAEPSCSVDSEEAPCQTKPKLRGPLSKRATSPSKNMTEPSCSVDSEEAPCQTKPKLRGPLSKRATSPSKDMTEPSRSVESEEAPCQTKPKLRGPLSKRATDSSSEMLVPAPHLAEIETTTCPTGKTLLGPNSRRATFLSKDVPDTSSSTESDSTESAASTCITKKKLLGPLSKRNTCKTKPSQRLSKKRLGLLGKITVSSSDDDLTDGQNPVAQQNNSSEIELISLSKHSVNSPKLINCLITLESIVRLVSNDVENRSPETDMITKASSMKTTSMSAKVPQRQTSVRAGAPRASGKNSTKPVMESNDNDHQPIRKQSSMSKPNTPRKEKAASEKTINSKQNTRACRLNPPADHIEIMAKSDQDNAAQNCINRHAEFDSRLGLRTYVSLEPIAVDSVGKKYAVRKKAVFGTVIESTAGYESETESERSLHGKSSTSRRFNRRLKKPRRAGLPHGLKPLDSSPSIISDEETSGSNTDVEDQHSNSDKLKGCEKVSSRLMLIGQVIADDNSGTVDKSFVHNKVSNEEKNCVNLESITVESECEESHLSNIDPATQEKTGEAQNNVGPSVSDELGTIESVSSIDVELKHRNVESNKPSVSQNNCQEVVVIEDESENEEMEQEANSTADENMLVDDNLFQKEDVCAATFKADIGLVERGDFTVEESGLERFRAVKETDVLKENVLDAIEISPPIAVVATTKLSETQIDVDIEDISLGTVELLSSNTDHELNQLNETKEKELDAIETSIANVSTMAFSETRTDVNIKGSDLGTVELLSSNTDHELNHQNESKEANSTADENMLVDDNLFQKEDVCAATFKADIGLVERGDFNVEESGLERFRAVKETDVLKENVLDAIEISPPIAVVATTKLSETLIDVNIEDSGLGTVELLSSNTDHELNQQNESKENELDAIETSIANVSTMEFSETRIDVNIEGSDLGTVELLSSNSEEKSNQQSESKNDSDHDSSYEVVLDEDEVDYDAQQQQGNSTADAFVLEDSVTDVPVALLHETSLSEDLITSKSDTHHQVESVELAQKTRADLANVEEFRVKEDNDLEGNESIFIDNGAAVSGKKLDLLATSNVEESVLERVDNFSSCVEPNQHSIGSNEPMELQNTCLNEVVQDEDITQEEDNSVAIDSKRDYHCEEENLLADIPVVSSIQNTSPEGSLVEDLCQVEMVSISSAYMDDKVSEIAVTAEGGTEADVKNDIFVSGLLPDETESITLALPDAILCEDTAATPIRSQEVLDSSSGSRTGDAFWNGCLGDFDTP